MAFFICVWQAIFWICFQCFQLMSRNWNNNDHNRKNWEIGAHVPGSKLQVTLSGAHVPGSNLQVTLSYSKGLKWHCTKLKIQKNSFDCQINCGKLTDAEYVVSCWHFTYPLIASCSIFFSTVMQCLTVVFKLPLMQATKLMCEYRELLNHFDLHHFISASGNVCYNIQIHF